MTTTNTLSWSSSAISFGQRPFARCFGEPSLTGASQNHCCAVNSCNCNVGELRKFEFTPKSEEVSSVCANRLNIRSSLLDELLKHAVSPSTMQLAGQKAGL